MKCRFCDDNAVAVFSFPNGCVCYPDDRTQALCTHHSLKATPIYGMVLVEDLTVGNEFTEWWKNR
jgi:hypothetical protein